MLIRSQNVLMNQLALDDVTYITNEIDATMNRSRVQPGDVLLNITGASIGRVTAFDLENTRANVNQHVCVIRPKSNILLGRYLAHFLCSPEFQAEIDRIQHGGTRQALTFSQIADFQIPLLPLIEQQRIAQILDKAEALRAKRSGALPRLDTLTQAIFLDLFGDSTTNQKGWPVRPVSDYVSEFQGGKSIEAESTDSAVTKNRVLKVSAVTVMTFSPHESKPVPDSYDPPTDHFVRVGDLLFSRANTTELVGAVAYVDATPPNLLLPDKLWRFVWQQPMKVEPLFVWALFQTHAVRREIERRATGTSGSMKNISQEKVFGIATILPPLPLQQEFVRSLAKVKGLKSAQNGSLVQMCDLFASLQDRAFRGEL